MQITYLGHAGFCLETEQSIILMDPWLSPKGAFDAAWFQYPKNHFLGNDIRELFDTSPKEKYIYISHEHKDHFDLDFLKSLCNRDFTILLANFTRPVVKNTLMAQSYDCKDIVGFNDNEQIQLKDCTLTFFIVDEEIDCDSAILVQTKSRSFLNLNDCKIYELLPTIIETYGQVDVFAMQFSGAIWFPTCYDMYTKEEYERISQSKVLNKFATVAKALEIAKPAVYLPSAGPPCFLDPLLIEKNFEKINIFPRAPAIIAYLNENNPSPKTQLPEIMPGDVLDAVNFKFIKLAAQRVKDADFESYVRAYAKEYEEFFKWRKTENEKINPRQVFLALRNELEYKVEQLKLVNATIEVPLYWGLSDYPEHMYKVDLKTKTVQLVEAIEDLNNYWRITSPAWQVNKVLQKKINWSDFVLTFRATLSRKPDVYQSLIHGYLAIVAEGLGRFCVLLERHHEQKERIVVEFQGKQYSILRYCPHQGGDLKEGWFDESGCLVCPRHRWKFDLLKKGKCIYNNETIDAICLEEPKKKD